MQPQLENKQFYNYTYTSSIVQMMLILTGNPQAIS